MFKLIKIYRRNIYGIIGTLIFHILLFGAFIISDVDVKGNVKEEVVLIEFPDLLPEEEIEAENEEPQENFESDEMSGSQVSNIASSQLAVEKSVESVEDFLNEDYLKEIEEAKKLVSDVKNQLSKETINIDDIKMPVKNTEGLNKDSIKNIAYTGESNIEYFLENRYVQRLPIPVYLSQVGGKVIVDIEVNREGIVTKAVPQESGRNSEQLYNYAKAAAMKTVFNADPNALVSQKGSIHYTFISQ